MDHLKNSIPESGMQKKNRVTFMHKYIKINYWKNKTFMRAQTRQQDDLLCK